MKFRYTGPDEEITLRQVTFKKGEAVDVDAPEFQRKLSSLDFFKVVKPRGKAGAKDKK